MDNFYAADFSRLWLNLDLVAKIDSWSVCFLEIVSTTVQFSNLELAEHSTCVDELAILISIDSIILFIHTPVSVLLRTGSRAIVSMLRVKEL